MELNFIESICVKDGTIRNAKYHLERMEKSAGVEFCKKYLGKNKNADLFFKRLFENTCNNPKPKIVYKFRIIYNSEKIIKTEAIVYEIKKVEKLKLISVPEDFNYKLKYEERSFFNKLKMQTAPAEPLIIKNFCIMDTTYSNICFKKNDIWLTPTSFLLNGTMRQFGIKSGLLKETKICTKDLSQYSHLSLINAMLPVGALVLPISVIE